MDLQEPLHSGIVGQDYAQRMLANTIKRKRVPHAILLWGPVGTGKLSLAWSYAAALNCTGRGESVSACGSCPSCHAIATQNHPDVRLTEPDGQYIKIDQIRDVIEAVSYRSYFGGWKVWILRHADRMRDEAANSLLRVLEDPPAGTVFLLTAENLYSMLPTVISRCRLVRFNPVPQREIESLLIDRRGVPPEKARLLSVLCGGSVGAALEACSDESLEDERVALIQGIRDLAGKPVWEVLDASARVGDGAKRASLDRSLRILECWYRDLLVYRTTRGEDSIANLDMLDQIRSDAKKCSVADLLTRLKGISEARMQLAANANAGLVMDNLFMTLVTSD
ncbi:MAG: DNA polymerase III subunit delta' [Firmicutes bacterium]|nr:DNA polymerase III subunit delta' [Bacillota bacterium]